jgi:hypothetical protein
MTQTEYNGEKFLDLLDVARGGVFLPTPLFG